MESAYVDQRVSDRLETELPELSQIVVKAVAGEVTVAAGARPHIEVRRESGGDVFVEVRDGVLYVSQPEPGMAPIERFVRMVTDGRRHRCRVTITAPPQANIDITVVSADVVVSGFEGGTNVKAVSGTVTLASLRHEVDV